MNMWQFIYASKNNKFSILFDAKEESLEFCYWREYAGNKFLNKNEEFKAGRDKREYNGIERGLLISKDSYDKNKCLTISESSKKSSQIKIIKNISECDIQAEIEQSKCKSLVFIGCSFNEEITLPSNFECGIELAFLNCAFNKNFIVSASFSSNIWIIDCRIKAQFSLKDSKISGNAHLESNCFDGEGGVSFMGVNAKNLYIDFGTIGSEDMFWFNEMNISGVVSIGGNFKSKIQILSDQFNPNKYKDGTEIGKLFIGVEYTDIGADEDNLTISNSAIEIKGLKTKNIAIFGVDAKGIKISDIDCSNNVCLQDVSTNKDLKIHRVHIRESNLIIDKSSIGRHMFIQNNDLPYITSLAGTSVSETSYIENNTFSKTTSNINFSKFTTNRLLFNPANVLYANKKNNILKFRPHKFSLLLQDSNDLGDQYCSLKHWFSDSGKLKEEDMSYFHMNDCFAGSSIYKAIFGVVFGWGIRLTNILISSLLIMALFFGIYMSIGMTAMTSLTVTIQSFFGILLDPLFEVSTISNKQEFTQEINWLITTESIIGIFFVAVIVGAYVRKMLR